MILDSALLVRLCRLARVRVDDREADGLRRDLERILLYVCALDEIDPGTAAGRAPVAGATIAGGPAAAGSGLRDDAAEETLSREEALRGAPAVLDGHFCIPAVIRPSKRSSGEKD